MHLRLMDGYALLVLSIVKLDWLIHGANLHLEPLHQIDLIANFGIYARTILHAVMKVDRLGQA